MHTTYVFKLTLTLALIAIWNFASAEECKIKFACSTIDVSVIDSAGNRYQRPRELFGFEIVNDTLYPYGGVIGDGTWDFTISSETPVCELKRMFGYLTFKATKGEISRLSYRKDHLTVVEHWGTDRTEVINAKCKHYPSN